MDWADCIMCVSELTRQTVINHYHQDPRKCFTVHNAVYPLKQEYAEIPRPDHSSGDKVVTFLGRITMQKGPEYFVEAANMVLHRTHNVRFCMAGSGDMMDAMIYLAAERGISDRFHFPGFMRGKEVYECLKDSDVYVMPSVSEPFGISPLEAMQCGTPSIISKQSGCAEILTNCIKVDYWDIHAMADKGVVATLLPLTAFALKEPYARGREMIDAGCAVALATDLNPGSCFSGSIPLTFALACIYMKMSIEEAITALTLNGAAALNRADSIGSIEVGKKGDFVVLNTDNYHFLPYYVGMNCVNTTIKGGVLYPVL